MIMIPQANPLAEYLVYKSEIDEAIQNTLSSGHYILAEQCTAFEEEFARYLGVKYAVGVASGTDALQIALRALKVGTGDEVITVSYTAVATVSAIEQCGALPVFVDIDPDTYTIDPLLLENVINVKTKAIIPVHLYGHPANLESILTIAHRHGISVLEDCAQAHGAEYKGRKVGSWGDVAAFSFYPTKNLGAIGDGGLIATDNEDMYKRIRMFREYGWSKRYISESVGFNSRLDEIQASILRVKLKYLDINNEKRRALANLYTTLITTKEVVKPIEMQNVRHVFHLYVIRHPQREKLKNYLAEHGIGTNIHYPLPVHLQPAYLNRLAGSQNLLITENLAKEVLSLPLFPQLESKEIYYIAEVINEFKC